MVENGSVTDSRTVRTWLTDMDGVLVREEEPIAGAKEFIAALREAEIPFSMTQFPALFGDTPFVRADSHSFVLPAQASVDPAARAAAYDMAVSMLRNSLVWATGGGHIPALSAVAR